VFDAPSRREFVESLGNYRLLNNVYKIECENIPQEVSDACYYTS
jgi:hypothetical protein